MDGDRLARLRRASHWTQAELAERVGTSRERISAYERGENEVPDEIVTSLARLFNVSLDYLYGLVDEPLPLRRNGQLLHLPADFPPDRLTEVMSYVDYVMFKTGRDRRQYSLQVSMPLEE